MLVVLFQGVTCFVTAKSSIQQLLDTSNNPATIETLRNFKYVLHTNFALLEESTPNCESYMPQTVCAVSMCPRKKHLVVVSDAAKGK